MAVSPVPGMETGVPTKIEELQPTEMSKQIGGDIGLSSQQPAAPTSSPPQAPVQQQPAAQPPHPAAMPMQQNDIAELAKNIEIMHAKIDAIRSSLESMIYPFMA